LSAKQPDGKWGPPVNLGPTINTRYNEECPYISEDGLTLHFSSYGHYNMGGYDIFYAEKKDDGTWNKPVNMGYPINTTDDDLFFQPFDNGNAAYYSIYSPRGLGQHDIYFMNIYSKKNPRYYLVSGKVRSEDRREGTPAVTIYAVDTESGDKLESTSPEEEGTFALNLKQGSYELHFLAEGYEELIRPLRITGESDKTGIRLADELVLALLAEEAEPLKEVVVFEGEESQIKLRQTRVEGPAGVPVTISVSAPRGRMLLVKTFRDSVLISTDSLVTERRRTQVQVVPLPGSSEVVLELMDEDGNIHRNSLFLLGIQAETRDIPVMEDKAAEEEHIVPVEPDTAREEADLEVKQHQAEETHRISKDRSRLIIPGLAAVLLAGLIIIWWRRRKKGEKQRD
jgi:hypothetical protein